MTFFGQIGTGLGTLFILLSLLNVFYGLKVAGNLRQRWGEFQTEPLQAWQKGLIDRAAFYLGIPLGVVIHELGHALAVWLFGGQVVDAGYGFYWGYVSHIGYYTPGQHWFISIAGTIGSLIYGVVMWLLFRRIPKSSYQYFAIRILRVHLTYSLIFYPLFTLFSFVGDWKVIYDFQATPLLSGITLVVHLSSLAMLWWADRRGLFEMPAFETTVAQARFDQIRSQAVANPQDTGLQLNLVDAYRRSGMLHTANHFTNSFLKDNPKSAEGHLLRALLAAHNKREIPKKARDHALQALSLGLDKPIQVAQANLLAGQYSMGVGKTEEAINRFSQGIGAAKSAGQPEVSAELYYLRAAAERRKSDYGPASRDIEEAIRQARAAGGRGQAVSRYEAEKAIIEQHAGQRTVSPPQDRYYGDSNR